MKRTYPKKEGRTFKYHGYTDRLFKRLYKAERYIMSSSHKSIARILVRQMGNTDDEVLLEKLEAEMLSLLSPKQKFGYLD